MKITIEIPNRILQAIVDCIEEYSDITITVDELKIHPKLVSFLQTDIGAMYFQDFEHGLEDVDFVEYLGLKKD